MTEENFDKICTSIAKISPYIRFVGVIGKTGEVLASHRRDNLEALLDAKNTKYQFTHLAIKSDLEAFFDESLGVVEFEWEEREKVQIISFAIKRNRVWVSIDKKVIRTEVLRIIDSCLPMVKKYHF